MKRFRQMIYWLKMCKYKRPLFRQGFNWFGVYSHKNASLKVLDSINEFTFHIVIKFVFELWIRATIINSMLKDLEPIYANLETWFKTMAKEENNKLSISEETNIHITNYSYCVVSKRDVKNTNDIRLRIIINPQNWFYYKFGMNNEYSFV